METLSEDRTRGLLEKFEKGNVVSLLEFPCQLIRGSSTGADDVFVLTKLEEGGYRTKDGYLFEIEPEALRMPISITDFGRYSFHPSEKERIIFPYHVTSDGYSLFEERELEQIYPKAFAYLSTRKKELEQRNCDQAWYGFSRPGDLHVHDRSQIVVPLIADKGSCTLLPENMFDYCLVASAGFSISISRYGLFPYYVLALLNSKALFWYLKQTSHSFYEEWITSTLSSIGQLPIRRIDLGQCDDWQKYDQLWMLVEIMLALEREMRAMRPEDNPARARTLLRQMRDVEKKINTRVYALYGLTEEEIKVVEGG